MIIEDGRGLIWDNGPPKIKAETRSKGPEFRTGVAPLAGYQPPTELRPFCHLPRIGLDIETLDPKIKELGPGCYRRDSIGIRMSRVVGVGIAYSNDDATYYPTEHAATERNVPNPERFYDHLRHEASQYEGEIVGANLQYDLDWLWARHRIAFPKAKIRDVQIAAPLLDENRYTYALEALANLYGLDGKASGGLVDEYGPGYIANMDLVDPGHAAIYGERDCTLALDVYDCQIPELLRYNLWDLFELESDVVPMLLEMRRRGVRVDLEAAERSYEECLAREKQLSEEMKSLAGFRVEIWSADSLARAYKKLGIETPVTEKTKKPSIKKQWLEAQTDELSKRVIDARAYNKTGGTFLKNYLLDQAIKDGAGDARVHCQFHPLKSDNNGTVSGRFSSSGPNLQNIPSRHDVLGPMCRSVFIPEEDHDWGCADWSQIEYRLLVHFANIAPGIDARAVVQRFRDDPSTDFHQIAAEITGKDRKTAKNINFGVVYGMGVPALAATLGVSLEEAKMILAEFHREAPFLNDISNMASARANAKGEIITLLGRHRRFNKWEIRDWNAPYQSPLFATFDEADEWRAKSKHHKRGTVQRAMTHSALNALLQGSAADVMKKAMVDMWKAGLFAPGALIPHLTVHDELDPSVPRTDIGREAWQELKHIMSTAVELSIPLLVDAKTGINWEAAK